MQYKENSILHEDYLENTVYIAFREILSGILFPKVVLSKIKLKFVLEHSHSLVWLYLLRVVVKPISKHFL